MYSHVYVGRAICNLKNASQETILLTIKAVNLCVNHDWRIDWKNQRYGSYWGRNRVIVRGLSAQIRFKFSTADGVSLVSSNVSLGQVEHNCKILNSNILSEIFAQTALDWFSDPLTRLIQTASQTEIESFLKSLCESFSDDVWKNQIFLIFPKNILEKIVYCISNHLPGFGVNI